MKKKTKIQLNREIPENDEVRTAFVEFAMSPSTKERRQAAGIERERGDRASQISSGRYGKPICQRRGLKQARVVPLAALRASAGGLSAENIGVVVRLGLGGGGQLTPLLF